MCITVRFLLFVFFVDTNLRHYGGPSIKNQVLELKIQEDTKSTLSSPYERGYVILRSWEIYIAV